MKVPDILVSGNHEEIKRWRKEKSIERTFLKRNDLISDEDYNKLSNSKNLKKESKKLTKFSVVTEFNNYPDW